jgi:hypothetical protein
MGLNIKKVHRDGTSKIYASPSFDGTYLYFTGAGDNKETGAIGEGQRLVITNEEDDSTSSFIECSFNEDVYLKDGFAFWSDAVSGDEISLEVVLPKDTPMPSINKNGNADLVDGTITYITDSSTPDETWTGNYFLFPVDYCVSRFVNKMSITGSNNKGLILESSDTAIIPKIFKIKLSYNNYLGTVNNSINVSVMLELYRKTTTGYII